MATDVILGRAFMGLVGSDAERRALLALAESVPGVSRVADEMIPAY
jgi:osmotically-inducible protein OsmY